MKKTYIGSCHCQAVRFEADMDLAAGTSKCNCSICTKTRTWEVLIKPDAFRLLAGKDALSEYKFGSKQAAHLFCRHCGTQVFGQGYLEEIGGDYVAVRLASLDNAEIEELVTAPVKYMDGRNDNWWNTPAQTRHL
jgi:hypothetical protein